MMKHCFNIFCHKGDVTVAKECKRLILEVMGEVPVYIVGDDDGGEGYDMTSTFDRGGNLSSKEACLGLLQTCIENGLRTQADFLWKVDPDTALLNDTLIAKVEAIGAETAGYIGHPSRGGHVDYEKATFGCMQGWTPSCAKDLWHFMDAMSMRIHMFGDVEMSGICNGMKKKGAYLPSGKGEHALTFSGGGFPAHAYTQHGYSAVNTGNPPTTTKAQLKLMRAFKGTLRPAVRTQVNGINNRVIGAYHFVHVPKTGGTSIEKAAELRDTPLSKRYGDPRYHFTADAIERTLPVMATYRDPMDRLWSLFNYFKGRDETLEHFLARPRKRRALLPVKYFTHSHTTGKCLVTDWLDFNDLQGSLDALDAGITIQHNNQRGEKLERTAEDERLLREHYPTDFTPRDADIDVKDISRNRKRDLSRVRRRDKIRMVDNRYQFIHIPKTGGTSIGRQYGIRRKHMTADRITSDLPFFAVYRDPMERLWSVVRFFKPASETVEEFITGEKALVYLRPAKHFTHSHTTGKCLINHWIDFNDINAGLAELGLEPVEHHNKARKHRLKRTPEYERLLQEHYPTDFLPRDADVDPKDIAFGARHTTLTLAINPETIRVCEANLEICKVCAHYDGRPQIRESRNKFLIARVRCKKSGACGKWVTLTGSGCDLNLHAPAPDARKK